MAANRNQMLRNYFIKLNKLVADNKEDSRFAAIIPILAEFNNKVDPSLGQLVKLHEKLVAVLPNYEKLISPLDNVDAAELFLKRCPIETSDYELYIKTAHCWRKEKELTAPYLEEAAQKFCYVEESPFDCTKLIFQSRIGQTLSVQTRLQIYLSNANKKGFKELIQTNVDKDSRLFSLFENAAYKNIPVDLRTTFDNSVDLMELLKLQLNEAQLKIFFKTPPQEAKCDLYIKLAFRFRKWLQPAEAPFLKDAAQKASLEALMKLFESRIGEWLEPEDVIDIYLNQMENNEEIFSTHLKRGALNKTLLLSRLLSQLESRARVEIEKSPSIQKILELERQRFGNTQSTVEHKGEVKAQDFDGEQDFFDVNSFIDEETAWDYREAHREARREASRKLLEQPKRPAEITFTTERIKLHEIEEKSITKCVALFPLPLNKKLLAVFEINSYHKMALIDPLTHQATMLSRDFDCYVNLDNASLYKYYVLELPDKRILISQRDHHYNIQSRRVCDPVNNKLSWFSSMIDIDKVAINNEGTLAILEQVWDHTRCHFFNMNDLNTPFTSLQLSKLDEDITLIGDRFVTRKGTVIRKNKEGKFEENLDNIWARNCSTKMVTVGEHKDKILRIETEGLAQFQQQNKLSLWQLKDDKIEQCAEQMFYGNIQHVRPYWGDKILITSFDPQTLRGSCCVWDLKLKATEHQSPGHCRFTGFNPVEIEGKTFCVTNKNQIETVEWNSFQDYKKELESHCSFFPSPLVRMIAGYCIEEDNAPYSGAGPGPQRL